MNEQFDQYNTTEKLQITTSVYSSYPSGLLWFGAICCIIFAIVGTIGNFISILALIKYKKIRNATTAFIVNLCAADALYCGFTMPLTAVTFIDRDWKNGAVFCKLFALIKFSNLMVSLLTVIAITVNRYILIVHPNAYRIIYNTRNTAISILCLWLFPLGLISLPLFDVWGTLSYNPRVGYCAINKINGESPRILIVGLIIILPLIFICCYLKIYFVVKKSVRNVQKQDEEIIPKYRSQREGSIDLSTKEKNLRNAEVYVGFHQKKELRVLRIVLVIFICYVISTFPIVVMKFFYGEKRFPVLNIVTYTLLFASSVINPIIYIAMSREYRMAYKALFCTKLCGK